MCRLDYHSIEAILSRNNVTQLFNKTINGLTKDKEYCG